MGCQLNSSFEGTGTAWGAKSSEVRRQIFPPVAANLDRTTSWSMTSTVLQSMREQLEALRSAPRTCHVCQELLSGRRRVTCTPCFEQGRHKARDRGLYTGLYRKSELPTEKTCPRCKSVFTPHNNAQRYCTRACGAKTYNESRSVWRGRPCQHCGRDIEGRPRKFCDASCRRGRLYKLQPRC